MTKSRPNAVKKNTEKLILLSDDSSDSDYSENLSEIDDLSEDSESSEDSEDLSSELELLKNDLEERPISDIDPLVSQINRHNLITDIYQDEICPQCGKMMKYCICYIEILRDYIEFKLNDADENYWSTYNENPEDTDNECCQPKKTKKDLKKQDLKSEVPKRTLANSFILNDINRPIQTLEDLIETLEHKNIGQNQQKELLDALVDLNKLVGMSHLKQQIINQILFFIQNLTEKGTFLHTVITGSPGTGKTSVINIIARIYKSLGFLSSSKVTKVDRSDLVGQYLGSTALKTKKAFTEAIGGVILIDEAYSLSSGEHDHRDSFSKECIDTINQFLTENVDDIVCIVAGYADEIEKCFLGQNPGLSRRFPFRFHIDDYSEEDLCEILYRQLENWTISADRLYVLSKIKEYKKYFDGNGGSTRNLIDKCKIVYARRNFKVRPILQKQVQNKKKRKFSKLVEIPIPIPEYTADKIISKEDFDEALENIIKTKMSQQKDVLCAFCKKISIEAEECKNCSSCKKIKYDVDCSGMYS